ncbi:multiple sugar transport system permease protein [Gracilibacillus ureilyticus]|uniref:Multiple sugar transport system permease protein n=1 Tax=Gracilibacillus ureilyticus TaxID=531814 RepID=A0A1H9PLT7_9BACI|nr:carbohydrate ABC transporter permease [Gracilibacillus ureilyticus]SER49172.1 multiple sugar transport system permease protein [Gracilibacillus ureilyticus]
MRAKSLAGITIKYVSLILGVVAAILPILIVFFAAFKTGTEYTTTGPLTPPEDWTNFENFKRAFTEGNMLTGFKNTVIILLVSIFGTTIIGSMVAFVLNRFKFKGSKLILGAFLLATLIPGVTTQVATFQIVNFLGLFNTIWAAVILYLGTDIIAIYIFLQFMNSISVSLDESAMLDGASYFTIYRKIILPLLTPAIVTVIIVKGINVYNDFYTPYLYMPKTELHVISTALFKFKGPYGSEWEVICAGIMLAIIPTFIAFTSLQKYIYNGLTSGSVK